MHPISDMLAVLTVPHLRAEPTPAAPAELPASEGTSDAALVARTLEGDRWAMEALYRRHVRRLTNAVTRMIGRSSDADDVVQESFLTAFTRLSELREPAAFRGWLARIAVNEVRGRLRKRKWLRRLSLDRDDDDMTLESLASDEASPDVKAELARVDVVLAGMGSEHRMAWMLRHVEGWALDEVASALDCSLATAKRRIKDASDRIDAHVSGTAGRTR